jgi:NADH-quinone oxidoreductase subunit N
MALLYAQAGDLRIDRLMASLNETTGIWGLAGIGLMLVGLGFKLSVVPFHLWTPDVYEGGPGPAATFLATASKVAVFAVLLRIMLSIPVDQGQWPPLSGFRVFHSAPVMTPLRLFQWLV